MLFFIFQRLAISVTSSRTFFAVSSNHLKKAGVYCSGTVKNMKLCCKAHLALFLLIFSACSPDEADEDSLLIFSKQYDFSESNHGWEPGFADYPVSQDDSSLYELKYAYTDQPQTLVTKKSVMLSGKNLNKDLFMFLKKKVTGLAADTEYTITFNVELASTCEAYSATSGGAYLKAGAIATEPRRVIDGQSYVMNIDKGNDAIAGRDVISLGNIVSQGSTGFTLQKKNNAIANTRYVARTNSDGELWLLLGTDSTLEGTTAVFYMRVNVVFSAS